MPRVISFIVLLAIILLVGVVFFQVMAQFIVPLFLACVLLVVFQPLHGRILGRMPKHPRIAALITTILILLVVLLPLVSLGWRAYGELRRVVPHDDATVNAVTANASGTLPRARLLHPTRQTQAGQRTQPRLPLQRFRRIRTRHKILL